MRGAAFALAGLCAAGVAQSQWVQQKALAFGREWEVPKPIAGGDYFPDSPHHRAGIIHQFYPVAPPIGDGEWAEPNGMTDFNGFIAQVFMGGTAVDNAGNRYIVDVDNRVYQGEYIATNGERAWGTFCEIWIDLYDPSSGAQVHDFSPGNGENVDDPDPIFHLPGLFWLVRMDDDNVRFAGDDRRTVVLKMKHLLEFDRFQVMGPGNEAMHLTFTTTYRQQPGPPTIVKPLTTDPTSPYNWAGTIWTATARGTFSAIYDDGTFSVTGTMDSALATEGTPGHMGYERNGVFARRPAHERVHHLVGQPPISLGSVGIGPEAGARRLLR